MTAGIDGTSPKVFLETQIRDSPILISSRRLLWSDDRTLRLMDLDSTVQRVLCSSCRFSGYWIDPTHVYYQKLEAPPYVAYVVEDLDTGAITPLASLQNATDSLAGDGGWLYWSIHSSLDLTALGIRRVPLTGGAVELLTSSFSSEIAVVNDQLFWFSENALYSLLLSPRTPQKIILNAPAEPGTSYFLAASNGSLFWVEAPRNTTFRRIKKRHREDAPITLGTTPDDIIALAIDNAFVYAVVYSQRAKSSDIVRFPQSP